MILSHILAMDENRAIGKDNKLPWHIPEDLKFFKDTTQSSIMIMGRKTFDSLGRVLPGRFHIVITRQSLKSDHERVRYVSSLDEAIKMAQGMVPQWREEVFIVGGAEIYKQSVNITDRIYLTKIHTAIEGDTFYPDFNESQFDCTRLSQFDTPIKYERYLYRRKV